MSTRMKAVVALAAQFLVWGGTVGLVYVAVPKVVPLYLLSEPAGNPILSEDGIPIITGFDKASADARADYLFWSTACLVPMTIGIDRYIV
jgi:hypothetical protein